METAQKEALDLVSRFKKFLWNFIDRRTRRFKYRERLAQMALMGQKSLIIDFDDITIFDRKLAHIIEEEPDTAIEAASKAIKELVMSENPDYAETVEKFYPRFRNLSRVLKIRDLSSEYIGKMIAVEGILTRLTKVSAKLVKARFIHLDPNCMAEFDWPETGEMGERIEKPIVCPICGKGGRFQLLLHKSKFVDWQKIVIQEKPEEIPPGQIPRSIEIVLTGDLVDTARPGDRVMITGILRVMPTSSSQKGTGKAIFTFYIDANYVDVQQKVLEEIEITREDEEKIKELARDPWIREKIIASIAPAIYGHWEIKEAIALQLFGGVPKPLPDGTRIRGDIHVLLVGDPGTAKSQLLQYAARLAPRGIYTSGKGATAAGLTASVLRDKATGEYYLEAGALVIADGGLAAIDEIDKMREEDRSAIHEALEQQSYHYDFLLQLADGRYVKIGEFVDKLFEKHRDKIIHGKDTEILSLNVVDENIELLTYNPETDEIIRVKPDRISRHKAPGKYVKILFSNGRSITVTPEHPIITVSSRGIETIPAISIKPGDLVLGVDYEKYSRLTYEVVEKLGSIIDYIDGKICFVLNNYDEAVNLQDTLQDAGIKTFIVEDGNRYLLLPSGPASLLKIITILGGKIDYNRLEDLERIPSQILDEVSTRYELEYYLRRKSLEIPYSWADLKLFEEKIGRKASIHMVIDVELIEDNKYRYVYDVTVEPTHLFISHGLILHNTISIAKAGIVARLNARASVLAAGNPRFGRYDRNKTISENIDLPPPILSRFDLIFIVLDSPYESTDRKLAEHILSVHMDSERAKPMIDPQLLKKYISYARRYVKPRLTKNARKLLADFYVLIRKTSSSNNGLGPIAITPRQLEALIRLSEAHAKMALKQRATEEDAEEAIKLMYTSLIKVGVDPGTGAFDLAGAITGYTYSKREKIRKFMEILDELFRENEKVNYTAIINAARENGLDEDFAKDMIRKLKRDGILYEPKPGVYGRIR